MVASIDNFNSSKQRAIEMVSDEGDRQTFMDILFHFIMVTIDKLKSLDTSAFYADDVVKKTVKVVVEKVALGSSREHFHWAPTQSGKTSFKAVMIIVYLTLNIPVVVLTKGMKESQELHTKISGYLKDSRFQSKILSVYGNEREIDDACKDVEEAFVLIIPDTFQRIQCARDCVSFRMKLAKRSGRGHAGCALILDEADAVIRRSEDESQRNEVQVKQFLRDLKPSSVKVTATPIPLFSKSFDKKPILTTSKKSIKNYVGIERMKLIEDLDEESLMEGFGKEVKKLNPTYVYNSRRKCQLAALFPEGERKSDQVQLKNKFPNVWNKKNPRIPRMNKQCIKLLRKEFDSQTKGVLVLVDTCPWVSNDINDNIFRQASGTQDYFSHVGRKKFIAIVVHSNKVFYRLPGHAYSLECKRSISELIQKIDSTRKYGLKMPVVVFGYHAMKRSRSFRSNQRVPTAMILCLGRGQSNENLRQAAGRVTFKGLDILKRNANTSKVKMLCPKYDFEIIRKYDSLVLEIIHLYQQKGWEWRDIYGYLKKHSKHFFLHSSERKTGNFVPKRNKGGSFAFSSRVIGPDPVTTEPMLLFGADNDDSDLEDDPDLNEDTSSELSASTKSLPLTTGKRKNSSINQKDNGAVSSSKAPLKKIKKCEDDDLIDLADGEERNDAIELSDDDDDEDYAINLIDGDDEDEAIDLTFD